MKLWMISQNQRAAAYGGDRLGQALAFIILAVTLCAHILYVINRDRKYNKLIASQQDTIQRLVNREPVTYQEVGKDAPEPICQRYSAWANETIDLRDD